MNTREKLKAIFLKKNLQMPANDHEELTFDSLSLMMLIYEAETEFKIKFGLSDFDVKLTFGRLIQLIDSKA